MMATLGFPFLATPYHIQGVTHLTMLTEQPSPRVEKSSLSCLTLWIVAWCLAVGLYPAWSCVALLPASCVESCLPPMTYRRTTRSTFRSELRIYHVVSLGEWPPPPVLHNDYLKIFTKLVHCRGIPSPIHNSSYVERRLHAYFARETGGRYLPPYSWLALLRMV